MTLIDTAEIYGNGDAEKLIGRVIAGRREQVFLVSKVWPSHVAGDGIERACEGSLARLGTDHLDLYLLHWPDEITDLSGVVAAFENLRSKGKIRAWGVSNFNVSDMGRLLNVPHGDSCATNQVPYSLGDRAIEHDLLPWCAQHAIPVMAYSPLGGASSTLLRDPTARAYWRGTWLLASRRCFGVDHSGRQRHCYSRIRQRGARKGERSRALIGPDIRGASSTGCRASAAQPLGKMPLDLFQPTSGVIEGYSDCGSALLHAARNLISSSERPRLDAL